MVKNFCEKWFKYKEELRSYIRSTKIKELDEYSKLVKILFNEIINKEETPAYDLFFEHSIGGYSGTNIYLIIKDDYSPNEIIITNIDYGSCSACDTLLNIVDYGRGEETLSEDETDRIMQILLHLLQHCEIIKLD